MAKHVNMLSGTKACFLFISLESYPSCSHEDAAHICFRLVANLCVSGTNQCNRYCVDVCLIPFACQDIASIGSGLHPCSAFSRNKILLNVIQRPNEPSCCVIFWGVGDRQLSERSTTTHWDQNHLLLRQICLLLKPSSVPVSSQVTLHN